MKFLYIIAKSLKEQIRNYWILALSVSMGPFFIFVYYLIIETSKPHYDILIVNNDRGISEGMQTINHGNNLALFFSNMELETSVIPVSVKVASTKSTGIEKLKNKNADAMIVLPPSFSIKIENCRRDDTAIIPDVELIGDLTNINYLISAVWANEILNEYVLQATGNNKTLFVNEIALGTSAGISDFDMIVPGILIVSLIMLMFTASIALVSEIENKTITRLKLSNLRTVEFLGGISVVQLAVGIVSVLLTLLTAFLLGFNYQGSLVIMIFIAGLSSLSIISFSLILAAVTKSANEILIAGNFPMFLFMFFTGAAFPLKSDPLLTIAGYPVSVQGFLSPTHAISALNKTLVMNMHFRDIIPEIISIVILTVLYFALGAFIFKKRHLRLT